MGSEPESTPLYFVKYRGACGQCGGAGEIDNPAWNLWQERYRVGRNPEETAAYHEATLRLEREAGPALLVCTHCSGSGQVEEEVPFVEALAGHLQELEQEVSDEVVAADANLVQRHDLFAAAAITGLMSGEMGRRLLVRPYHMGAGSDPSSEPLVGLRFARMVASAADLVARAMLEQIAYWDSCAGPFTGSTEATSSSEWGSRTSSNETPPKGEGAGARGGEGFSRHLVTNGPLPAASLRPTQPETPGCASASVDPPDLHSGLTHTSPPAPQAGMGSSVEDPEDGYDEPPWGDDDTPTGKV